MNTLQRRIIETPLERGVTGRNVYGKMGLIKRAQKLLRLRLKDAKDLVEDIFPEIVWGSMAPVTNTLWQKINCWYHKRIFERALWKDLSTTY